MTPQERDLITDLFERMRRQELRDVDHEAADLIARAMRANPDAAYQLVQSVIVQNMALERAEARIRDLEDDVREQRSDRRRDAGRSGGSFLGNLFGGGDRRDRDDDDHDDDRRRGYSRRDDDDDGDERRERTARAPLGGTGSTASVRSAGAGSPWSAARPAAPAPTSQRGGGSFLGTALTTATGVAGGMLLAEGIRGLFQGDSGVASAAEAAKSPPVSPLGNPSAATEASSKDALDPGVTEAGHSGEGGGLFDSLFGGGDDAGDDDLMDI